MEVLRLFIAVELDDTLRAALNRAQVQLQDEIKSRKVANQVVRWVVPQNIHLTLKFLGNSKPMHVPALQDALERIARNAAPFVLRARGLGCFPNPRRPNNVWVGLEGDVPRAALLARQIDDACAALGFTRDEHGFTPHLTLGRVKRDAGNTQRAALGELVTKISPDTYGEIDAQSLALISSDLRFGGPVYTIVSMHPFTKELPT